MDTAMRKHASQEGLMQALNAKQCDDFRKWWGGCADGEQMLAELEKIEYDNRQELRLLACWIIRVTRVDEDRTVWDLLSDERSRIAINIAERYANGGASDAELLAAERGARSAAKAAGLGGELTAAEAAILVATSSEMWQSASKGLREVADTVAAASGDIQADRSAQDLPSFTIDWGAAWEAGWYKGLEATYAQLADIIRDRIPAEILIPAFKRHLQSLLPKELQ